MRLGDRVSPRERSARMRRGQAPRDRPPVLAAPAWLPRGKAEDMVTRTSHTRPHAAAAGGGADRQARSGDGDRQAGVGWRKGTATLGPTWVPIQAGAAVPWAPSDAGSLKDMTSEGCWSCLPPEPQKQAGGVGLKQCPACACWQLGLRLSGCDASSGRPHPAPHPGLSGRAPRAHTALSSALRFRDEL